VSLFELLERPSLDEPVMILALDGWIDAGGGAASATERLQDQLDLQPIASFDTDALLDHRARRPTMHLVDGVNTGLTWPTIELEAASDENGNDLLLLHGVEPDHSWPTFCQAVVELAELFDVRLIIGLGAYPAAVPHTRPVRLASTASSPELARLLGFVRGTLDVPAGVQAAIERESADAGIPSLGLWAQVPHYASAMPYPAGGAALIEGLAQVADLAVDAGPLDEATASTRQRLDALVADSDEHRELVTQLEHHVDDEEDEVGEGRGPELELQSGDELAAEVERFLRDQD
jgi:hypothetical protein